MDKLGAQLGVAPDAADRFTSLTLGIPNMNAPKDPAIRKFSTGASRDTEEGKLDYEGFLNPKVLYHYALYMDEKRKMKDGTTRGSDDWQKGIPQDVYMKSLLRHVMELWEAQRSGDNYEGDVIEACCAVMFNAMGYLFEELRTPMPDDQRKENDV